METVVSGIRSTGKLHLGNYLGAIQNFVKMQHTHNCFFFIADYHSLTTHPTPENLHKNVKNVLIDFLASGLEPEKCTLYIQSDLPEVAELYLLLSMNAYVGELERCSSFKEKIRKQPDNINAGLLTYPVLMAADIIIHKANKVPVGKDQEQHLEMTRTFARRFNRMYAKDFFPEPEAFNFGNQLIKVPGLDGTGKMGKSEGGNNAIFLTEPENTTKKKIMRAVTDQGPTEKKQQKPEPVENLFTLMNIVSEKSTFDHFEEEYNNCTIRYGDLKKQLAEDVNRFLAPIREKAAAIENDEKLLREVVQYGADKARKSAEQTIREARELIGFKKL